MDEFVRQVVPVVAAYGPFPFGILIGMLLTHVAYSKAMDIYKQEREASKDERAQYMKLVETMQERIDKLHNMQLGNGGKES